MCLIFPFLTINVQYFDLRFDDIDEFSASNISMFDIIMLV